MDKKISLITILFGLILGSYISILILNTDEPKIIKVKASDIETIYIGKSIYWRNDTIWKNENYTSFLKVYPKKLLKGKTILYND